MRLMENKYLKFDNIEFLGKNIRNITDLVLLPDIPKKYFGENYEKLYRVENDRLIESIAFELYENTDYWDILMALNKITNSSQLPVNYDTILIRTRAELSEWMKAGKLIVTNNLTEQYIEVLDILNEGNKVTLEKYEGHPDETVKAKYLELLKIKEDKNELFRDIRYLSISDIAELESNLDVLSQTAKLDSNLIINNNDIE